MRSLYTIILVLFFFSLGKAGNVRLSGLDVPTGDSLADELRIGLRVSWEKSWYCEKNHAPFNWDAVWIFVKYKRDDRDDWYHASIKSTINGPLSQDTISTDNVGVMLYRKSPGYGTFSDTLTLVWDRVKDFPDANERKSVSSQLCTYAIEMVYVPSGAYYLGDGSDGTDYGVYSAGGVLPYMVQQETNAVVIGTTGTIKYTGVGKASNNTLSANYPKGFAAFYCMKTEITQGQYCDFLNKLNPLQIRSDSIDKVFSRTALDFGNDPLLEKYGNTIKIDEFGDYSTSTPERACNFMTTYKVLAYLAWAGLRPMSALEYEKACRGTVTPKIGEFAWGSLNSFPAEKFIEVAGKPEEELYGRNDTQKANILISAIPRGGAIVASPGRVGAFAENSTKREQAGASYYGILDLSGGVAEMVVHHWQGAPASTSFNRAEHGKGTPLRDYVGDDLWTVVPSWPKISSASTFATGYGHRGGHFMSSPADPATLAALYDPSMGQASAQGRKGGSGTALTIEYCGHEYDYSYGYFHTQTAARYAGSTYLYGYGGRGVRSF